MKPSSLQHRGSGRRALLAVVAIAILSTTAAPATALGAPSAVVRSAPIVLTSDVDSGAVALAYSADGVGFTSSVPSLFENSPKLVPGESVQERLWVRNDYDVAVNVSVAGPLSVGSASVEPSATVTLDPGASGALLVRLTLPETADNSSQGQTWPVTLRVNISEKASSPAIATEPAELGYTGGMTGIWPLAVAAIVVGVGAYTGARQRKRPSHNDQQSMTFESGQA